MTITIVPATHEHVTEIICNLREHDKPTFAATSDPIGTLSNIARRSSRSYAAMLDGELLCLWGINSKTVLCDAVYMWMVTTPLAEKHSLAFARRATRVIREVLEEYGEIEGNVVAWNTIAIKWVTWLGAELIETSDAGVFEFKLRRDNYRRARWVLKH